MKILILPLLLTLFLISSSGTFKADQLKNERVKTAYQEKLESLEKLLQLKKLQLSELEIFLRAYKADYKLEVWAKNRSDKQYKFLGTYPFCSFSGTLGPKRQQGDLQVPEGFYYIDRFNPNSNFYLSLGINYPNASDKIRSKGSNPGGDIFIHGNCVTIGCIPITDAGIKELYVLAVEAQENGQKRIPVHIFPAKLNGTSYLDCKERYRDYPELLTFWQNLKPIHDYFEQHKQLPDYHVNSKGNYVLNQELRLQEIKN